MKLTLLGMVAILAVVVVILLVARHDWDTALAEH
jgi:hypothetical protein